MNDQTLIENADYYAKRHREALAALNAQQADRLSQGGDVTLDWSQMRNRVIAQAKASIAADLESILARVRRDDPTATDEHARILRSYLKRSLHWVRTPSSTDAMSNVMDGILNDERVDLARELGIFD